MDLCIYHGSCLDGFGAAYAVRKAYPNIQFHVGVYNEPPPSVAGLDVVIVDFSYSKDVLKTMIESCNSLLILDHHKTAEKDLDFLPVAVKGERGHKARALFDMDSSGAMLAWRWFHDSEPPQLIKHIEDRDLWRFALPNTREVQNALASYPYDFTLWDELMKRPLEELIAEGRTLERKQKNDISIIVSLTKRRMNIGGYDVPVANVPITLTSEAGNLMAQDEKFAACYYDDSNGRNFSLRSIGDFDVSEVAKQYGGGGHRNAAGFKAQRSWEGELAVWTTTRLIRSNIENT